MGPHASDSSRVQMILQRQKTTWGYKKNILEALKCLKPSKKYPKIPQKVLENLQTALFWKPPAAFVSSSTRGVLDLRLELSGFPSSISFDDSSDALGDGEGDGKSNLTISVPSSVLVTWPMEGEGSKVYIYIHFCNVLFGFLKIWSLWRRKRVFCLVLLIFVWIWGVHWKEERVFLQSF